VKGQVLRTGQPARIDSYAEDPRIVAMGLDRARALGVVTGLAVPILIAGRVEGALLVNNRTPRRFTDRDEAVLVWLADHAAVAVRNARLHAEREEVIARLRQSHAQLRRTLDGLGPYMFAGLLTTDGTVIEANRPALEAAGLRPEDVLGKPLEDTYWWAYSDQVRQALRDAVRRAAAGEGSRYDVAVRIGEGRFITLDFSLQPRALAGGRAGHRRRARGGAAGRRAHGGRGRGGVRRGRRAPSG
jgi:GAF domain-containing protein